MQILCAIIFVGLFLRLWGFWNIEGGDEYNEVFEALRIASGNFNTERWIKKTFKNILAIEYGIYFVIGWIFNMFSSLPDFARHIVRDFTPLLYVGRITSAILGTFSIVLLYQIGKKIYSREVGLIAAVLLAFNYICVYQSHLCLTDIPLLFFVLLSLFYIVGMLEKGKLKHYALAAFFAAFAINTKIYGVVIGIPFVIVHFIRWSQKEDRTLVSLFASKNIFVATGIFFIGMLLSNPEIAIGLPKYLHSFLWRAGIYTTSYQHVPPSTINSYVFYLKALIGEMGLPMFIMACVAFAYSIIKHEKQDILIVSFCFVLTAILMHSKYLRTIRYMIPLFPFLFLMIGRFLIDIMHKLEIGAGLKNLIMAASIFLLILHPAINIYHLELSLSRGNTNKMAKEWILEHIPSGSKLLVDMGRSFDDTFLRLPRSRKNIMDLLDKTKNLKDGEILWGNVQTQIVDSYSSIFFKLILETLPSITYDITSTGLARLVKPISYYREQNYDYVILRSSVVYRTRRQTWKRAYPISWQFYRDIHKEFKLVKHFKPDRYTFGPTIGIYKIH